MNRDEYITKRIEMIERELMGLKRFVSGGNGKAKSLKGLWKGVDTSDEEIEAAKRSLSRGVETYEQG